MNTPEHNTKIAHAGVGSFGNLAGVLLANEIGGAVERALLDTNDRRLPGLVSRLPGAGGKAPGVIEKGSRPAVTKQLDLHYIRNWSYLFDLKILCLTVFKGFVNKNAY